MNHIFYMRNGWTKITISIPLRTAGLGRSLVFQRWIPWKPDATLALLYEMPAGGKRRIWWVNWLIWWKILKSHPLLKVVSLIFLQRKVKVFRFSCSFFLRETCMKCSNIFFLTNKQVDHHPIQLVGGGKISVALLFGIFLKLPAETH